MMLRIGNCRTRTRGAEGLGFTLIELILVMGMLMIVLGVAFPSLQGFFHGRHLDSEAQRFVSLARYGQSRAVSEGIPMVLWVDAEEGTYGLEAEAGYADVDGKAVEFGLSEDVQVEVQRPAPGSLVSRWQSGAAGLGNLPVIRFMPDGFISQSSLEAVVFRQGTEAEIWIGQSTNRLSYEIQANHPASARR